MRVAAVASFVCVFALMSSARAQDDFDDDFASPPPAARPATPPPSSTDDDFDEPPPARTPPPATPAPSDDAFDDDLSTTRSTQAEEATEPTATDATEAAAEPEARPAPRESDVERTNRRDRERFYAANTFLGPTGGIHVVDAGSGPVGTFRLSLNTSFMFLDGFLEPNDEAREIAGALALSWTLHRNFELFAAVQSRAASNAFGDPSLIQALGDWHLGLKAFHGVTPWMDLGGDVSLTFLNPVGDIGVVFKSTTLGIRGNVSFDLRALPSRSIPLIARFSASYRLDNSSNLVTDVEDARYQSLDEPLERELESRHLITRFERFGLGVNRTDSFDFDLGFEFPIEFREDLALHPIVEWRWSIPVNRQGYVCPFIPDGGVGTRTGRDGCLDIEGVKSFPMTATLGARIYPAIRGLSLLVAADVALTGQRTHVRELAATAPYHVILGLTYAYDTQGRRAEAREVERVVEVPVLPPVRGYVVGQVVESGAPTTAIAGATLRFPGTDRNPIVAGDDGRFTTYVFPPGAVQMEIAHPDYESGVCSATIPADRPAAPAPAPVAAAAPETDEADEDDALAPAPTAPPVVEDLRVEVTCELVARPRNGAVTLQIRGDGGAAVANARIEVSGPASRSLSTDATGNARLADLPAGTYSAQIIADGYLVKQQELTIVPRGDGTQEVTLVARPRRSLVQLRGRRITIKRQVNFVTDSDEIINTSDALLSEVADTIIRHPELVSIEIEGHTDDRGGAEHNLDLSQRRAEAVRRWLIEHGVAADRLTARGYGSTRPAVPNITSANRARNRRVQFTVTQGAE